MEEQTLGSLELINDGLVTIPQERYESLITAEAELGVIATLAFSTDVPDYVLLDVVKALYKNNDGDGKPEDKNDA